MPMDAEAQRSAAPNDQAAPGGTITANVMRVFIQALQKTSGRNFEPLLAAAGLSRYTHALPSDDWSPATAGELVRLNQTVYAMLGEHLTRLFHRNCGEAFVSGVLAGNWGQETQAKAAQVPPEQKLAWFVHETAAMAGRSWTPHTITEDATAWYLAAAFCPLCLGLHSVSAPICASSPAMFGGLAKEVLGRRVRVVEVECVALGHPHCKYAFYK